ncbi:unnamed protein product [Protopolystoma xenopodis]|uniref:Uncharacterized protein n=1 Tax=Protopolystoma xenopodis TaxID=117903 RepID=A0A3S5B7Q8_9PLAT|nr:unnamed protein product [Protopolystoma xenopodis]
MLHFIVVVALSLAHSNASVLRADIREIHLVDNNSGLRLTLGGRTKPFKLIRRNGYPTVETVDTVENGTHPRDTYSRPVAAVQTAEQKAGVEDGAKEWENERQLRRRWLRKQRRQRLSEMVPPSSRQQTTSEAGGRLNKRSSYPGRAFDRSGDLEHSALEGSRGKRHQRRQPRTNQHKRLLRRNSRIYEMDGLQELLLTCSSCPGILPVVNGRLGIEGKANRWLVMGRRIRNSRSQMPNGQVQVGNSNERVLYVDSVVG